MLSHSSKYALKAVLYLARHSDEAHKLMVKDLYSRVEVPRAYLAKLLQELARHKVISSSRGPRGGFYLDEENRNLPLIRIIDVIDGPDRMTACMLNAKNCSEERPCALHALLQPARLQMVQSLKNLSIREIAAYPEPGEGPMFPD